MTPRADTGEVVGIAGLAGAAHVAGVPPRRHDVHAAMAAGAGPVPEDRKRQGGRREASSRVRTRA